MLVKRSFLSRIINRFWVKSAVVPQNPLAELKLDLSRPIIYVLDQNSVSDLLTLQKACRELALPDPYQSISLQNESMLGIIYLHDWHVFKKTSLKKNQPSYLKRYQQLLKLHQEYSTMDVQLVPVTFFWGRNPGKQKARKIVSALTNCRTEIGVLKRTK